MAKDSPSESHLDSLVSLAFPDNPQAAAAIIKLSEARTESQVRTALLIAEVAATNALKTDQIPNGAIVEVNLTPWNRLEDCEDDEIEDEATDDGIEPTPWEGFLVARVLRPGMFKVRGIEYVDGHAPERKRRGRGLEPDDVVRLGTRTIEGGKPIYENTLYVGERVVATRDKTPLELGNHKLRDGRHLVLAQVAIDGVQVIPVSRLSAK